MIVYGEELNGKVVYGEKGARGYIDVIWCNTDTGHMVRINPLFDARAVPRFDFATPPLRIVEWTPYSGIGEPPPSPVVAEEHGPADEPADSEAKVDAAVEAALEAIRKSPHQAEFEEASTNLLEACIRVAEMVSPYPSFEKTESLVLQWGEDRGILEHSNARAQLLKTMAELGELADAEGKNDTAGIVDGIGDVLVTIILYAALRGLDVSNCLALAYDEIKDRKGKMVEGGTFVKEAQ